MERKEKKLKDLPFRLLINGIGTFILAFFIIFAEFGFFRWLFATFVVAVASIALWEYNRMTQKKGFHYSNTLSLSALIAYLFSVFLRSQGIRLIFFEPIPVLFIIFFCFFLYFSWKKLSPIGNISTMLFGILYLGIPMGLIIDIMYYFPGLRFEGTWWVFYLIAVTKSADMGGYFIGRRFGKRSLALKLSPNKTFEGAIGALFASVAVSLLLCFLGKKAEAFSFFSYGESLLMGFIIGIFGQFGDLAESLLKRDAGVKDSNTLPGVGGILDMIDSILFTTPIVYYFIRNTYNFLGFL
jgi:phosphatidate cytidylyltransferase